MNSSPDTLRAWATVNLSALERNLKAIRRALPSYLSYIAVVKANAYGHGLAPVVTRLMRSEADAFAVANLDEASRLREVGKGWPVLVLSALLPSEYQDAVKLGVIPVVSSLEEIKGLSRAAMALNQRTDIHLKVDTGMGRLGVWYPDFQRVYSVAGESKGIRITGICTHFSSADIDPDFTALQRQRFLDCLHSLPNGVCNSLMIHADNSAGIESFPRDGVFNAARIGLLQFGVRPKKGSLLGDTLTEPALSFHSRIGLIKELPVNTPISYGKTHTLKRTSKIAVLTAGYADGLPTSLSNKGKVIIRDSLCPIIGRVTMDQTIVDITDLPSVPEAGEIVTLIGKSRTQSIPVTQFAAWSNQIEWEVFCSLSARTTRIYSTDSVI